LSIEHCPLIIPSYTVDMDAVAEVKSRLSIEDVIAQYVQLKRTGRNFKGLSPFSNEKTPSFIVSPEKQIWHDFSSGKGGDMFTFVMEVEGLDFKATLELLARQAGVDLDQFKQAGPGDKSRSKLKSRAYEALELATRFYQKQLTANHSALEYLLKDRQLSKETLLTWRLGYSPNTGRALTDFLTKHGFTTDELKAAGLTFEMRRRSTDMFRGRIMIPLCDPQGAVIGFTARLLADEPDAPKYINTPQTALYDKSRHVFGLHLAKESIRKEKFTVVVEGNMDVIGSNQTGVQNVVATAGTAMTEMHLKQLKRFSGDVRLCFDADSAGIAATERAIPLAQKVEVQLKIISIEGAKDPDELARKDVEAWRQAIANAVYATDWLIEHYRQQLDLSTAQGKKAFTDALVSTIRRLNDPVEQEHYIKKIADLTDTSYEAVKAKLGNQGVVATTLRRIRSTPTEVDRYTLEYQKFQDHFLAIMLLHPKLRDLLKDAQASFFTEGARRKLFNFIKENPDFKGENEAVAALQELGDFVKIITLQFEELYADLPFDELKEQASNLKHRLIDRYVKIQKHRIAQAMQQEADEEKLKHLIQRADRLNQLIK
jgi:DNA primase